MDYTVPAMWKLIAELEDRGVAVWASVAVMVAGVIVLLPFLVTLNAAVRPPTTGMVDIAFLTAGMFLLVIARGRFCTGIGVG